jgi:type IV secretory pathway VirB2 component (pilin)
MPYLVALVLVAAFTANVVFGAVGQERFVGNVGEMLILFAAAIVGILRSEARAKSENTDTE